MKILIAEDNIHQQAVIGMIMSDWGFEYDMASNGHKAVELAEINDGKYDLCLMDIEMPIMSGIRATRMIRKRLKYFPILGLSAESYLGEMYSKSGMDDFLEKPYNPDELYDKINELSVKKIRVEFEADRVSFTKEMPMNPDELQELIDLKKKGLTKLKILGINATFVVHRNIQNKIAYDLIGEGKELTEFIDRSEKEPGRCHLYKMNLQVTKDLFTPLELEEAIKKEDQLAANIDRAPETKLPR